MSQGCGQDKAEKTPPATQRGSFRLRYICSAQQARFVSYVLPPLFIVCKGAIFLPVHVVKLIHSVTGMELSMGNSKLSLDSMYDSSFFRYLNASRTASFPLSLRMIWRCSTIVDCTSGITKADTWWIPAWPHRTDSKFIWTISAFRIRQSETIVQI